MMGSKHKFDLRKEGALHKCAGGRRYLVNHSRFAPFQNMALAVIELEKNGFREPHWHPNADELTYCAEGKALITLFSPGNQHDTFTLSAGEVVHFPKGYLHHIENIHPAQSRFILAYNHNEPEDLDLSASAASMSPHVLASTFTASLPTADALLKKGKDVFIGQRSTPAKPPLDSPNGHKFNLERIHPQIDTPGGSARIVNRANFPVLEHLALFSLRLVKKGVREPHWHPNATELNFVLKGKARLTVLSPNGSIDTFDLAEGQGSVIPTGYFHHIENTGPDELHMTVFFSHHTPNDIGLSGALSAYSPELLADLFSVDCQVIAHLHNFQEDRMIVSGGG